MDTFADMAPTVFSAAGFQPILFAVLIFVLIGLLRKGRPLLLVLLTLGSLLALSVIDLLNPAGTEPLFLLLWQLTLALIYASSLYLFVKSLLEGLPPKRWWPHYLAVACCLAQLIFIGISGREPSPGAIFYRFEMLLIVFVLLYYGVQMFWYVQYMERQAPGDERHPYLRQLAILYLSYHVVQLVVSLAFSDTTSANLTIISEIAAGLALVYFAFLLIKVAVIQRRLQAEQEHVASKQEVRTDQKLQEIFQKLHQRIVEDRLYLDANFSLEELARLEQVNVKYLSQAINNCYGENFSRYINQFRLEMFTQQAQKEEHQHLSLLSIALDCGFSSKSTFNRVFKDHKGCTPTEWLKAYRNGN